MFGYACDDTPELMPLPIMIAHRLAEKLTEVRKDGTLAYLRPDGKTQVTIEYDAEDRPVRIDTVVLSTQHAADVDARRPSRPTSRSTSSTRCSTSFDIPSEGYRLLVNPTGKFVVGGPMGDAGLTGRKIIVDTYGGMARHGGGAFSGKDPSKVDRSAAYAMRWVAKNVVAAGLARRCEAQVAYAIGKAAPGRRLHPDVRHRHRARRGDPEGRPRGLRPASGRDHPRPRPAAPDLRHRPRRTATSAGSSPSSPGSAPTGPRR